MRHILVPPLIAQQRAAGHTRGAFDAVCLFVDTSGFTPLTSAMMAHGAEGAEAVADALTDIFNPLVEVVYAHGGFVAAFAGDAFKAVFPLSQPDAHGRAVAAAWQIRRRMAGRRACTPFGTFDLAVKVTVTDGQVAWGVWQAPEDAGGEGQRAAYWFEGEALARGLEADPLAAAGDVLLTDAVLRRVRDDGVAVQAEAVDGHWRVRALEAGALPAAAAQPARGAEALAMAGAPLARSWVLAYLGALLRHQGEYAEAEDVLAAALQLAEQAGDDYHASVALNVLGQVYSLQGRAEAGRAALERALALKRRIGDRWGITFSLSYLGRVAQEAGNYGEAQKLLGESLMLSQEFGDRRGVAFALFNLGKSTQAQGQPGQAAGLYRQSLQIYEDIGSRSDAGRVRRRLAELEG
jgi:tetratricopeptide (TPR) repeat protein